jgi:hypothetical protein
MIQFTKQYEIITKVWQSFKTGKTVTKISVTKEDLEYAKLHYRPERFDHYTNENFISVVLYIMYTESPVSKTDFISLLNDIDKSVLLESIKFKNNIINFENVLKRDSNIIKVNFNGEYDTIHNLFKLNRIGVITFVKYYETYPDQVKGRILKRDLKRSNILLNFFKIDLREVKWQL